MYTVQSLPVEAPASSSLSADGQTLVLSENSEIYEYRNHSGTFVLDQVLKGSGNVVTSGGIISTSQGELFSSVTEKILYSNVIKADTVSALTFVGEGTTQWNTDSYGINYLSNVGIGSTSNPSAKLFVSGAQTRQPVTPSYYLSKHLDNPDSGMILSGSGQVAAYTSSGGIVVVRSSNDWQNPESTGVSGYPVSISYDGNTILCRGSGVYYKVFYNGTAWGAPQNILFGTGNSAIVSSDGSFVAFANFANVVVSNNYTTFSNIDVPSALSIAFTDAAKQIAILNSDGTSVSIWDNKNPWTAARTLTVAGGTDISISGDGTVLCVSSGTSNVFRYKGGPYWNLELSVAGVGGYISADGKVFVNDSGPPYNIYYNTNLSTWTNIVSIRNSGGVYISSISSTGQVFLIHDISEGSNIYSITLPEPGYFQDAIQAPGFSVSSNGLVTASAIHSGGFSVQSAVTNTYTEVIMPSSRGTSVSYDGHWVAFGNYDSNTVRVYKDGIQFGSTITSTETYFGASVSLNRDGSVLAVGGSFGTVYIYTRMQNDWNLQRIIDTGTQTNYKPSLSGDGTRVILGSYYTWGSFGDPLAGGTGGNGTVYAYNTMSGHLDWSIKYYEHQVSQISTAISDDGETVVVAIPEFKFIYVYEYGNTTPIDLIYLENFYPDPSVSTNGKTIVLVNDDNNINVYNRVG
jgi:hypothetical protein